MPSESEAGAPVITLDYFAKVRCCACGKPPPIGRVNICSLRRQALWDHPKAGNLLTGYGPQAVAILCDDCAERKPQRPIMEAIELREGTLVYHAIESLPQLGLEPTHVLGPNWIRCLVCGMTSHNRNDIEHLYCGNCGMFHPIRPSVEATP